MNGKSSSIDLFSPCDKSEISSGGFRAEGSENKVSFVWDFKEGGDVLSIKTEGKELVVSGLLFVKNPQRSKPSLVGGMKKKLNNYIPRFWLFCFIVLAFHNLLKFGGMRIFHRIF